MVTTCYEDLYIINQNVVVFLPLGIFPQVHQNHAVYKGADMQGMVWSGWEPGNKAPRKSLGLKGNCI